MSKLRTLAWGDRSVVYTIAVGPDGRWIAAGGMGESAFCVWDLESGELVVERLAITKHVDVGTEVRFTRDGERLVVRASSEKQTAAMSLTTGTWKVRKDRGGKGATLPVAGPDSLECVLCKPSQRTKWKVWAEVFDTATRKRVATMKTPQDERGIREPVVDAAWHPDGSLLIAHAESLGVGRYHSRTGKLIQRLDDAPNRRRYRGNWSVAVHPTGEWIATTREDDRTARVWQLADNALVQELRGHAASHRPDNSFHPLGCRFGADGTTLVVNAGQKKRGGAITIHRLADGASKALTPREEPDEHDALDGLIADTIAALQALADTTARSVDPIIRRYLKLGTKLHQSPAALQDHFCVSSPSMPEQAGLDAKQCAAIDKRYGIVSRKLFR